MQCLGLDQTLPTRDTTEIPARFQQGLWIKGTNCQCYSLTDCSVVTVLESVPAIGKTRKCSGETGRRSGQVSQGAWEKEIRRLSKEDNRKVRE